MFHDFRYGVRMLLKTPAFTTVAVLSLALGIGANTALFSVMDAVLLRKLPVREPDRLVLFGSISGRNFSPGSYTGYSSKDSAGNYIKTSFPYQSYQVFRDRQNLLSDTFAFGHVTLNLNADGQADVVSGQAVSGNYYEALGVGALIGRTITDEDDKSSATPVCVISHRYWQHKFGGDSGAVGKQVRLNNVPFTLIGVTPPGFGGTMQVGSSLDVSIPVAWERQVSSERSRMAEGMWWLRIMGRLTPGATAEQARASLESAFHDSVIQHRAETQAQVPSPNPLRRLQPADYPSLQVHPGAQGEMNVRNSYRGTIYLLFGVVGLVLLIACANAANLLLSRAASRQKEIAVRMAMGARRGRLIRQLLTESLLLAVLGGVLGVLFAYWLKEVLLSAGAVAGGGSTVVNAEIDLRVLAFTIVLSSLTGILFGIAPAWRATGVDLNPALKDMGRSPSVAARSLLSKSLVVVQVAMSLLLLIGAGLFLRTMINLQNVDPGFNMRNLLLFSVDPSLIGYRAERLSNLYKQMSERIEAIPNVEAVTFSRMTLLAHGSSSRSFFLPGTPGADGTTPPAGHVYIHEVRENFLEALEIPVLAGRGLSPGDDESSQKVAVVNQTFARRYLGDQDVIGKRFGYSPDRVNDVEIVGLVRDAKYASARDDAPPTAYLPWQQELRSVGAVTFEVRTSGEPSASVTAIRQAVRELDEGLPLNAIKTQIEQADETLAMERLFTRLLNLFGLLAQLLAAIGLYGVLAYGVSQRSREIGIRMALGASRSDVLKVILKQGMILTIVGVAAGLVGAYVLTKYLGSLTSLLYGVDAADPLTFGLVAAFLTLVALAACFVPARTATRVDPMVALRYE